MNYAKIRKMDVSNGEGLGVSLFVSGCHFHCNGCFNSEAWDFNYGEPWTERTEKEFLNLLDNEHVERVSILGGEPLADENIYCVSRLINRIKNEHKDKKIWLYTGYNIEDLAMDCKCWNKIACILKADYVVDGPFVIEQRDLNLKFRGSSNQRVLSHDEVKEVIANATKALEDLVARHKCMLNYDCIDINQPTAARNESNEFINASAVGMTDDGRVVINFFSAVDFIKKHESVSNNEAIDFFYFYLKQYVKLDKDPIIMFKNSEVILNGVCV